LNTENINEDDSTSRFRAVVLDIREEQRIAGKIRWQVQLDHTGFGVGDVGAIEAISRSGALLDVPVLSVSADGAGDLWHTVEKPLAAGTEVTGRVQSRAASSTRHPDSQ